MVLSGLRATSRQALRSLATGRRLVVSRVPALASSVAYNTMAITADPCSQSNYKDARVLHSAYEFDVNFAQRKIDGYAKLGVRVDKSGLSQLVLDTSSGLAIHSTQLLSQEGASPQSLTFTWGEPHKVLGTPLVINLPAGLSEGVHVQVGVRFTAPTSSNAVQWLEPEMTADKTHPYLFTQCQAIHARALVPCQDTPSSKTSYSAAVRVPADLTALMSAVPVEEGAGVPNLSDVEPAGPTKTFYFTQKVPIPSYLIALAVGRLESRELGPRSRVWSEPSVVEAAAYEFADTARFLDAGESIAGEYVWGRYDLLLLPPSFPYGGMENPSLTFVTPTLLAGDRSLTNVVAHEIAHSWTGNLVTNATWQDFFLNEGFTVFLERKILGKLHGETRFQFAAANGAIALEEDILRFGLTHPYTCLVPDMSGGVDPDDVFSKVPYEKGFYLLYYLQTVVGGAAVFDVFLKAYIDAFKFKTVTAQQFKEFFLDYFKDNAAVSQIDWQTWYHAPGRPPVTNTYDTSLAQAAYDLAINWHTADVMGIGSQGPADASSDDISGWSSEQLVAFLDKLAELRSVQPMHVSMINKLGNLYNLYKSKNSEIRLAFYRLAIPAEDGSILPLVVDFITEQGRMKFLRPLYRALYKSRMGKQLAVDTFVQHRAAYHPIAQKMLALDLGVPADAT